MPSAGKEIEEGLCFSFSPSATICWFLHCMIGNAGSKEVPHRPGEASTPHLAERCKGPWRMHQEKKCVGAEKDAERWDGMKPTTKNKKAIGNRRMKWRRFARNQNSKNRKGKRLRGASFKGCDAQAASILMGEHHSITHATVKNADANPPPKRTVKGKAKIGREGKD
ncbi:hypothetical protein EJ110_NYTH09300 [Nymphaea thermarum]|nr:hypothetical protein EJ110_NYTH09300 [Nymphaea thermarum]